MPKQILKKIYSINTLVAINKTAINQLSHSTQVYDRILRVANSKANLAGKKMLKLNLNLKRSNVEVSITKMSWIIEA